MVLTGCSYAQIMREQLPGRRTIKRWEAWLKDNCLIHCHALKARFPELGKAQSMHTFWLACWQQMSLAKAMFHVHAGGELVP